MPMSHMNFLSIPPELIHQILSHTLGLSSIYFPSHEEPDIYDRAAIRTIGKIRLTCRYLNAVARPFTFHSVNLQCAFYFGNVTQFLSMLCEDPTIASFVRTLHIYNSHGQPHMLDRLWHNLDLPKIFERLTSLQIFAFELLESDTSGQWLGKNIYEKYNWNTLGKEMSEGIRNLVSRPSIISLKFTNITSLSPDVITVAPNLKYLQIKSIDQWKIIPNIGFPPGAPNPPQ